MDDTPSAAKPEFRVESQTDLPDLQAAEAEFENQTEKTASEKSKRATSQTGLSEYKWSMDFIHDTLENGKKVRSLNIIDDFNREILNVTIASGLPSTRVISELN